MATALTSTLIAMYLGTRPGIGVNSGYPAPTSVFQGTVSELAVGDYLVGSRQLVVATGATTGGVRALTLRRSNASDTIVNWVATSNIRFAR